MTDPIRLACISDSPKCTTGFGNVAHQIYRGFHDAGYEVGAFGILDPEPDIKRKLPYVFWPTTPIDLMGYQESMNFVYTFEPDIVWLMTDPGNNTRWVANLLKLKEEKKMDFKIICYPPIEGTPVSPVFTDGFKTVIENDGEVVLWCKAAQDRVFEQTSLKLDYIYFGNDHAPWRRYSDEERSKLRDIVGFTGNYIVGSIGTNKRTKGFDTLVYAAAYLKEIKQDKGIKFYCHTDPIQPQMGGINLLSLTKVYGVQDMFLWKPTDNLGSSGSLYVGIEREKHNLESLLNLNRPATKFERMELWNRFDFISRLNCLDMYMDTSQVEGWGLPAMEAMACGVPTFVPTDYHVRDEVHAPGGFQYESLPRRYWSTWNTGARLLAIDPEVVAKQILDARNNGLHYESRGIEMTSKYTWADTQKKMNEVVEKVYAR